MRISDNDTPTSEQLVKDGAAIFIDIAQELELLHLFEMENVLGDGYSTNLHDAQHLVEHAEWCLRNAAKKLEQHYGGIVAYNEDSARFVW